MYCVTLTTGDPEKLLSALRKHRVDFKVGAIRREGVPKTQKTKDAQRIYDLVAKDGLAYEAVAFRSQVSRHTVIRIIQNPKNYGVKGPPIRRLNPKS